MTVVKEFDETILVRLQQLGGLKLARRMLELFLEHTPKRLESARLGFQTGDLDAVSRAAHALKSTAGHLSLVAMQALATDIERLAMTAQHEPLAGKLHDLEEAFARVAPILEKHRSALAT